MTLLITIFAAVISTVSWYCVRSDKKLGFLSLMYWGASLMWLVDAFVEYIGDGAGYFEPELSDIINDAFLGLSVVALGLVIWTIYLLIKDPDGKVKELLSKKK
ncbi:MAG: hypothetical protein K6F09_07815 [Clostridiales bacterium]|nr:hypothetical protein [Clostridiales bacterium]